MKKLLLLITISILLSACMSSKKAPPIDYYSLSDPAAKATQTNSKEGVPVLRLVPASIDTQYAGKSFVYRESASQYISDPYNQFLVPPNLQITDFLKRNLVGKVNATVTSADNLLLADYVLQININALYADYTNQAKPQAVTVLTAYLFNITDGNTKQVASKQFKQNTAITPNDPKALISAYDKNLEGISVQLQSFVAENIK